MLDVLVAGAGPAGSIAALTLARAGARVVVVDRETFPRDKLCGDTLNPGAVRLLRSIGLTGGPLATARPLRGMCVTSAHARVVARYGGDEAALAIRRRDLDAWLLDEAIRAGARFESGLVVREPLIETMATGPVVRGLVVTPRGGGRPVRLPSAMTIAADGRRSVIARRLGLALQPATRRWAFGAYAHGITGMTDCGEMHIRSGWYAGLAPLADDLVNVCVVTARPSGRSPLEVIRTALARDPTLAARIADAEFDPGVRVLGPLAADVSAPGVDGLLLAGDAAGFVDPMTGDGLHLAMQSAILAASTVLTTLETGDLRRSVGQLEATRQQAFGAKLRFNRALRWLVDSPRAVDVASAGAHLVPEIVRRVVRYAGDAS